MWNHLFGINEYIWNHNENMWNHIFGINEYIVCIPWIILSLIRCYSLYATHINSHMCILLLFNYTYVMREWANSKNPYFLCSSLINLNDLMRPECIYTSATADQQQLHTSNKRTDNTHTLYYLQCIRIRAWQVVGHWCDVCEWVWFNYMWYYSNDLASRNPTSYLAPK